VDLGRRNVLLLALCQAAFVSTQTLTATVGSLAGHALAPDKALATAPSAALVIGTALSTIPASLLMRRVGRRLGFIVGAGLAVAGGAVAASALSLGSFGLLAAGSALLGCSGAFAQQYRFAAAETSSTEFRSRAISFVVAGGLAAGFIGPLLARGTKDLLVPEFLGSYACVPILAALSISLLLGLRMPASRQETSTEGHGRSLARIVRQPVFIVAVVAQMMAQGVMNLLMTGTPLAMMAHHHDFADTAFVIQWHVVGMFLPGFFTGALIQRWGEQTVIRLGVALNILAVAAGVADVAVLNFWIALTLNGIGWNFMFVAGSALVTKAYVLSERTRVQAANDFLVFGTAAVAALSSGQVLHRHGWHIVLGAAVVMLLIASVAALWRLPRTTWAGAATRGAAGP
jgi:MFS family permease